MHSPRSFVALTTLLTCAFAPVAWAQNEITASIGDFLTPISAAASSAQSDAGRLATRLIDGSGWAESAPGSGVYLHSSNVFEDGAAMWNGEMKSTLDFDLGQVFNTSGLYVWNYNEGNGYNARSVKELKILSSLDNQTFVTVGDFTLEMAPGANDYRGQTLKFAQPTRARYFRFEIESNYRVRNLARCPTMAKMTLREFRPRLIAARARFICRAAITISARPLC